jgi:hypothetical protein
MKHYLRLTAFLTLGVLAGIAGAESYYASTDYLTYDLKVTTFNTFDDLWNGQNGVTNSVTNRDMSVYFLNAYPGGTDANILMTAWYYTTDPNHGEYSGWGNPSNTNKGFLQLYDATGETDYATSGKWTTLNPGVEGGSVFNLSAGGANADYLNWDNPGASDHGTYSRLWDGLDAPENGGPGLFYYWTLDLTANGLTANLDSDGFYTSINHPTEVSGTFSGAFANHKNGKFYTFEATIDSGADGWAWANRDNLNGAFSPSTFSAQAVPEPATMLVLGAGASVLAARRRNRK